MFIDKLDYTIDILGASSPFNKCHESVKYVLSNTLCLQIGTSLDVKGGDASSFCIFLTT